LQADDRNVKGGGGRCTGGGRWRKGEGGEGGDERGKRSAEEKGCMEVESTEQGR